MNSIAEEAKRTAEIAVEALDEHECEVKTRSVVSFDVKGRDTALLTK